MPHAAIKLVGGANSQETQAQNENGGIYSTQLIRYMYDPNGLSLVQKLGGWDQFYGAAFSATVRALWAWEDLNNEAHLAVGTETGPSGSAQLIVITNGSPQDITPTAATSNTDLTGTNATAGSNLIVITDNTIHGITTFNSVYIATQIAIGGIVLYGLYACNPNGVNAGSTVYTIYSVNQLGNPNPAIYTDSSAQVPMFSITNGSLQVAVNLPGYTYAVGDTFPVVVATTVGNITFFGNYVVISIVDSSGAVDPNNFQILSTTLATSTTSGMMNNGQARYIYSFGSGAIPAGEGFGDGAFGQGGFGVGTTIQPATGTEIDAIDWTLDNYGDVLISCPDRNQPYQSTPFQPIYQWEETSGAATIITNAPPVNDGVFVAMPQRQLVAWGSTETGIQDPLLINWSDVGNYNQWIALVTNQAGSYRIPKGSKIVSCVQGPQQGIVWTDIDVWAMQYIGTPYVYSFNEIGTGCGLIARKAAATVNGIFYWMGFSQFYSLGADGVQTIPCPVWDVVFQNLNTDIDATTGQPNTSKIRVAVNSRFNEIQWFYPSSGGGGEVDSYVKYTINLNVWDFGQLGRTAWVDQSVLGPPIGADPTSLMLYQHETSNDAAGVAMQPYFQTGYYALAEGDYKSFIDLIWPDMKWGQYDAAQSATVQISFYVVDYPGQTPTLYGPYSVTQATQYFYTRFRGRLVSIRVSSSDLGSFWRIGNIRYRYAPDGKF